MHFSYKNLLSLLVIISFMPVMQAAAAAVPPVVPAPAAGPAPAAPTPVQVVADLVARRVVPAHKAVAPINARSIGKYYAEKYMNLQSGWFCEKGLYTDEKTYKASDWFNKFPVEVKNSIKCYARGILLKRGKDAWLDGDNKLEISEDYLEDFIRMGIAPLPKTIAGIGGTRCERITGYNYLARAADAFFRPANFIDNNARADLYAIDLELLEQDKSIKESEKIDRCQNLLKRFPNAFAQRILIHYGIRTSFRGLFITKKLTDQIKLNISLNASFCTDHINNNARYAGFRNSVVEKLSQLGKIKLNLSGKCIGSITTEAIDEIGKLPGVNLNDITELDLSHNNLTTLPEDLLTKLPRLKRINIAHNKFTTDLPVGLFEKLAQAQAQPAAAIPDSDRNIELIDLSGNKLTTLPNMGKMPVRALKLSNCDLATLPADKLPSSLVHLIIDHNKLSLDDRVCAELTKLTQVTYLDISHNKITSLNALQQCGGLKNLEHLLASHNDFSHGVYEGQYEKIELMEREIQSLRRDADRLRAAQNAAVGGGAAPAKMPAAAAAAGAAAVAEPAKAPVPPIGQPGIQPFVLSEKFNKLKTLDLSYCNIKLLRSGDFDSFPGVEHVLLGGNQIASCDVFRDKGPFSALSKLKTLQMGGNKLKVVPQGLFANNRDLEMLHLGCNEIGLLEKEAFRGLSNLKELYLYGNGQARGLTIIPQAFAGLTNLTYLDLSFNNIMSIVGDMWQGLDSLTHLNLAKNKITALPSRAFKGRAAITDLDLSGNGLSCIAWDSLSDVSYNKIYLKENNIFDWNLFKLLSCRSNLGSIKLWFGCLFGGAEMERSKYWRIPIVADVLESTWKHKAGLPKMQELLIWILGCGKFKKVIPELILSMNTELQEIKDLESKKNPGEIQDYCTQLRNFYKNRFFNRDKVKEVPKLKVC